MWFKKKSVLLAEGHYNTEKSVDGTDWRTVENQVSRSASQTLPSAADAGNYFYLPALGNYYTGKQNWLGYYGAYWSSSANPWYSEMAYSLGFNSSGVYVNRTFRDAGDRVDGFE